MKNKNVNEQNFIYGEENDMSGIKKFSNELDYIIYILLSGYMLVDCITGFLRLHEISGISQPYKMLLIFLMIFSLRNYIGAFFYVILFTLVSVSLVCYFFNSYTNFSESLAMQLRIIMTPILFIYLKTQYKKVPKRIFNLIKINTIVMFINLVCGLLGFGDSTYKGDSALGIKGFFYDGNALAATLFTIYVLWMNLKSKNKYRITLVFLFFGILIGTKVSMLSIILYFCTYIFFDASRKKRLLLLFLIPIVIILLIFILLQTSVLQYQIERAKWLFHIFKGNYLSVFLSGRNIDLVKHYDFYNEKFSVIELLFGFGFLNFTKIIELDFFDTFFSYGLIFFLCIFGFYFYCFSC